MSESEWAQIDIDAAADSLRSRLAVEPRVVVVLGSGLGGMVAELVEARPVPFGEVPGFPSPSVTGHTGSFIGGLLGGSPVLLQSGRYHFYEGLSADVVAAPVRVAVRLGVDVIVFTNAAGGILPTLEPGDLALLDDHINVMFRSPLVGPVRAGEARFPDMSAPYDPELQRAALDAAAAMGIGLTRATYAGVLGPSYETAAEVRMLSRMGADVVGMSTVPEVLVARAAGVRCLGFSVVTNKATGLGGGHLSHDEVIETGREAGRRLGRLLAGLVPRLVEGQSGSTK